MINRRQLLHYAGAAGFAVSARAAAFAAGHDRLPRRKIPGTDETLAIVGYGNATPFGEGQMDVSKELVNILLERGGSYIDTSGRARQTIGKIMNERHAQDELFLGTYISGEDLNSMRQEARAVLDVQGGNSLDLVITRAPVDLGERREQFEQLKEDGLTRYVGVGRYNQRFYPAIMKLMDDGAVDFIQINYSIMEPEAANEIIPLAVEKKIAVLINRPFINGDYFGMVRGQQLPEWAAEFDCESWAQFSLKYILANPAVNCVLTETSNPEHAIDNLGAGYGRLPNEDHRKEMEKLIRSFM